MALSYEKRYMYTKNQDKKKHDQSTSTFYMINKQKSWKFQPNWIEMLCTLLECVNIRSYESINPFILRICTLNFLNFPLSYLISFYLFSISTVFLNKLFISVWKAHKIEAYLKERKKEKQWKLINTKNKWKLNGNMKYVFFF